MSGLRKLTFAWGDNDYVSRYAVAMTDLMFDVIGHSISYTDKVIELELLRERLQDAICTLDIAIEPVPARL